MGVGGGGGFSLLLKDCLLLNVYLMCFSQKRFLAQIKNKKLLVDLQLEFKLKL